MTVRSITIRHNPVTAHEQYLLNLASVEEAPPHGGTYFTGYLPSDRADGGFWSTSFQVTGRLNLLRELFQNGLGRHVEAWGDGLQDDFEGYIHEMSFHFPPDLFTISIENMANKIWMRADTNADGAAERTTAKSNAESITRYGTKELVLSGGELVNSTTADQAVQAFIDLRAFPRPEARIGGARGREVKLDVFCRGYIHTLGWRIYNQTAQTGTTSITGLVQTVSDSVGEFIALEDLAVNTTTVTKEYDADRKALDILQAAVRLGDVNNNRWVLGMRGRAATDAVGRTLFLREAAPTEPPPV
jgi:hypothetical protein